MLIVDVSNLAHIGTNGRREMIYNDVSFKAIPFILNKVASMVINTEIVYFVFDPKADGKKLDYFRTYNPQVVYETNVFYDLLRKIGFNAIRIPGFSADDIICNLADYSKHLQGKKTILTEDRDLVCAVYLDNETGGTIELLGPTVSGDHITPFNMYALTKVPYNFMNAYKTMLGCKSDKIKALTRGSLLWKEFLTHIGRKSFRIRGKVENAYQYVDISLYNNKDYVLKWLAGKGVDGKSNADAVYPKVLHKEALSYKKVDWRLYNTMFNHMFGKTYINQRRDTGTPQPQTVDFIKSAMEEHKIQDASVFEALPDAEINTLRGLDDFEVDDFFTSIDTNGG